MAKAEASVEELVGMIERGELRLPEMQRRYVWRSPRVRDLLDSLYRGYPSGAILIWETDESVPLQDFAIRQERNPYQSTRLLLDGQQRLTSLSALIRGEPVTVRGHTHLGIQTASFAHDRWWFGGYGDPKLLLVTDAGFQMKGRYEFDCTLGIEGMSEGRLLSARGRCEKDKGCTGSVQVAVPGETTGLKYLHVKGDQQ